MFLMDIVILPSRWGEGLSRGMIEAMALGKIVIASDIPSNPELLGPDFKDFIFKNENEKDLARLLQHVLENKEILERSSRPARERAEELFDIKKNTQVLEEIYKAMV